ncbi:MAG: hypothetical protein SEPTF4163_002363 [Sporothrix epigloea]
MFTQPIPAPAPAPSTSSPGIHSSTPTSPASPTSRTSRLRGLSYLRNYTHSHLLNREQNTSGSGNNNSGSSSSRSGLPSASTSPPASTSLVRTETYPLRQTQSATLVSIPPDSAAAAISTAAGTRLYSVSGESHQLCAAPTESSLLGVSDPAPSQLRSASSRVQYFSSTTAATESVLFPPLQAALRLAQPLDPILTYNGRPADSMASTDASASQPISSMATSVMTRSRSATEPGAGAVLGSSSSSLASAETLPSIRLSPFPDPRATRPSLRFAPMARTLPTGSEVIRVGRYSERDGQPNAISNAPSAAHVGFKSKVVSRRHCEFWYEGNQWYIRDVKSSSGTFLNHIRLSAPGTESKPYEVKDGDIVQLGIDFKGGEEMIFRCVKMRVELNRNWQNKLNPFK